jgi:hypothetical protein
MRVNWKKVGEVLIVTLIIVNGLELGLFYKFRNEARLYHPDVRFPLPHGYLLDKSYFSEDAAPCFLIRVSADACPYCRLDRDSYTQLVQQARKKGCKPLILTAQTGQQKLSLNSGEALQLQYVDMKLGRALYPFMTPQTILLDAGGRVIWDWEGAMDDAALSHALQALSKLR